MNATIYQRAVVRCKDEMKLNIDENGGCDLKLRTVGGRAAFFCMTLY